MKVYLNVKDSKIIEIELDRKDVELIHRKDSINIGCQYYYVNAKTIFFTSKNEIDYIALHVKKYLKEGEKMFGFELDDVLEIGSEIAVGAVTGAVGAKVGKEIGQSIGGKTGGNIGEIAGALAGGYAGSEAVDSIFDVFGDSDD